MTYGEFVRRAVTIIFIVAVTFFGITALSKLEYILLIVFTCWVLSVGLNQAVLRFRRFGMNKGLAILSTVATVFFVITIIFVVVVPPFLFQARDLIRDLPNALEQLVQSYDTFRIDNPNLTDILPEFTVADYRELIGEPIEEVVGDDGTELVPATRMGTDLLDETPFDPLILNPFTENANTGSSPRMAINLESIMQQAIPVIGGISSLVGNLIANLTLIVLITSYLMFDPLVYYRPIIAIVPKNQEKRVVEIISKIRRAVVSWMGTLAISVAFTSVMVTLVHGVFLQIPNGIALGVIAGLGSFIPNLGYYLGLVPIIIFTAVADPVKIIPAALLYWAINEFEGKVVSPNVIRNQLNIPAGVILPFQLVAATLFGFLGIVLAIPLLAIFVILWQEIYVYDTLDKREHSPKLIETVDGDLILLDPEEEEDEELQRRTVNVVRPYPRAGH